MRQPFVSVTVQYIVNIAELYTLEFISCSSSIANNIIYNYVGSDIVVQAFVHTLFLS